MTLTQLNAYLTFDDPDALDALLRDPDPEIRRAAVAELAGTTPNGTGDTLAWMLADSDASVRRAAAGALLDLPDLYLGEEGVQALHLAVARGRDAHTRETAAELLRLLTADARELYAQGLHDGEPHLRVQAILGLVALRAAAEVAEGADDPARDVRVAVAEGLARLPVAGRAVGALAQLLTDHDPVVRMAALDSAAEAGMPDPLPGHAVTAIAHASWQVRKRAALALGAATAEVAVEPLIRALRDRIVDVRRAAVEALETWASDPRVVTALTETLNDPDPGVRTQARWALA
jgi:HEAT repeat protein